MNSSVLCLDVAFRNIGWALYDLAAEDFSQSGIIRVKGLTKKERAAVKMSKQVENSRLCGLAALSLSRIISSTGVSCVIAEMPHSGGRSFSAVSAMSMALSLVSTVCALGDVQLHCIQPIASKRIVDPQGGAVTKVDTIEFVKARYDQRRLPKAVSVAEHIADAMMCIEVVKKANPSLLHYEPPTKIRIPRRHRKGRRIYRARQSGKLRIRVPDERTEDD